MADATLIQVAEAVKDGLNANPFALEFTATREYVPVRELDEMGDALYVAVVPTGLALAAADRTPRHTHDYTVDVGIQQKLPRGATTPDQVAATCDPLMALAEAVCDLFRGRRLLDVPAVCVEVANSPVFHPPHLDEPRVFTTVVTLTYRMVR